MTVDELYTADEVFFTGTAAEVTPIRQIDDVTIGSGSRGPITQKIQAMYFDAVHGRLVQHRDWLTLVNE
jgi:branched-chain amino acid aminotransferase